MSVAEQNSIEIWLKDAERQVQETFPDFIVTRIGDPDTGPRYARIYDRTGHQMPEFIASVSTKDRKRVSTFKFEEDIDYISLRSHVFEAAMNLSLSESARRLPVAATQRFASLDISYGMTVGELRQQLNGISDEVTLHPEYHSNTRSFRICSR